MHRRSPVQGRGARKGESIVKSLLSRRPENAFIFARVTRHSMVCELTGFSRSQNGREFVTNAWLSWFPTFTTRVITGSVAVWEALRNSADCDCFSLKTQSALGGNVAHFRRSNLCSNQVDALEQCDLVVDVCTHHHHPSARRDPMRRVQSVSSIPKSE